MIDETHRRHLFVAIDRATRWVYVRTYRNQYQVNSTAFLRRLRRIAPMVIEMPLTENGSQFTDRFTRAGRQATGQHVFDLTCNEWAIAHCLCRPRHPKTNGMVECFNGRIGDLTAQTRFTCAVELDQTLRLHPDTDSHCIPQRALNHRSPLQALRA